MAQYNELIQPTTTMRHPLVYTIEETIKRERLCDLDRPIYVALSGGSDSVALLLALGELGYKVGALHCNFALRGEASDGDEAFVKALCQRLGVALETKRFRTRQYAQERGLSIEMAARALRYEWFAEVARREPLVQIAIAHNAQDQVETLLLNLASGTGLRGLAGMPYQREAFVRPMMDAMPEVVTAYLREMGQGWRHDESNDDEAYRRNYIRHTLIPAFERINEGFVGNALKTIAHLRGAEQFYREAIEGARGQVYEGGRISIRALMASAHPETLLFELLRPYGFGSEQCHLIIERLPHLESGKAFCSPRYRLVRSWEVLELLPLEREEVEIEVYPRDGAEIETPWGRLEIGLVPTSEVASWRCPPEVALLDWDKIERALQAGSKLTLRPPKVGERMRPLGLRGTKLISRIFIDKHVAHSQRERTPLLLLGDTPLWLVGYTTSHDYRITAETKMILRLRLMGGVDRGAY